MTKQIALHIFAEDDKQNCKMGYHDAFFQIFYLNKGDPIVHSQLFYVANSTTISIQVRNTRNSVHKNTIKTQKSCRFNDMAMIFSHPYRSFVHKWTKKNPCSFFSFFFINVQRDLKIIKSFYEYNHDSSHLEDARAQCLKKCAKSN